MPVWLAGARRLALVSCALWSSLGHAAIGEALGGGSRVAGHLTAEALQVGIGPDGLAATGISRLTNRRFLAQNRLSAQSDQTQPTPQPGAECHPSYVGVCLPFVSDVDCAGGQGNGPVYVEGPIRVIGPDTYGLDRDGNGIGCE